jgi:hypothetical protein
MSSKFPREYFKEGGVTDEPSVSSYCHFPFSCVTYYCFLTHPFPFSITLNCFLTFLHFASPAVGFPFPFSTPSHHPDRSARTTPMARSHPDNPQAFRMACTSVLIPFSFPSPHPSCDQQSHDTSSLLFTPTDNSVARALTAGAQLPAPHSLAAQ